MSQENCIVYAWDKRYSDVCILNRGNIDSVIKLKISVNYIFHLDNANNCLANKALEQLSNYALQIQLVQFSGLSFVYMPPLISAP